MKKLVCENCEKIETFSCRFTTCSPVQGRGDAVPPVGAVDFLKLMIHRQRPFYSRNSLPGSFSRRPRCTPRAARYSWSLTANMPILYQCLSRTTSAQCRAATPWSTGRACVSKASASHPTYSKNQNCLPERFPRSIYSHQRWDIQIWQEPELLS